MVFDRLRRWIEERFIQTVVVTEEWEEPVRKVNRRARIAGPQPRRCKRVRRIDVPPSDRFVWGMVLLLVCLIGIITLDIAYIIVKGQGNSALEGALGGLITSLAAQFLLVSPKKGRG